MTAAPFEPLLRLGQAIAPVGEFERMVEGEILAHRLLHGSLPEEFYGPLRIGGGACHGIVGHEFGGRLHKRCVSPESLFRGIGAVGFLGHIYEVRLLPDEERTGV